MTVEYHVVLVPLFRWELIPPDDLQDLQQLAKVVSRLFSFQWFTEGQIKGLTDQLDWNPILSRRLSHITHEVHRVHDITNEIIQRSKEDVERLKIKYVYATDFAIELVSASIDVFSDWSDVWYDNLCRKLFDFLFGIRKPSQLHVGPISTSKVHVNSVVVCRIILCEDLAELQAEANKLKLQKAESTLYVGGRNAPINDNMFNFISTPWNKLYVPNTIATLKPEKLAVKNYQADDELNFLMFMMHSIGKFYVIYESIESACTNLEWSSWYLSRLFEKYESKFCFLQRNFSDIAKGLSKIENKIRELIWPLTRIKTAPDVIAIIQRQYGGDFLGVNFGGFVAATEDPRLEKYIHPSAKEKLCGEELIESTTKRLESLAKGIIDFMNQFKDTANSWKELWRSARSKNQLLVAIFSVFSSIILDIISRFL